MLSDHRRRFDVRQVAVSGREVGLPLRDQPLEPWSGRADDVCTIDRPDSVTSTISPNAVRSSNAQVRPGLAKIHLVM